MEAIDELSQLSDSMKQAASLLADEDPDETSSSKRPATFLNVVALGNVGAGKSAVLNSLIGHPVLPTGENGATRAPIIIELSRESSLSSKAIILQIDNKSQQVSASALRHSLQDRLSKGASGKNRDEINLKLRTSTAPPLKLVDLPGLDQRIVDESMIAEYAQHNDAILLVIVPASQASEISSSRALKIAKEYDPESTRTIGIIGKIDQAAENSKALAAVQALLSNQGPPKTTDIPWVAVIGQSVSIASAQSGSGENSLETAWRAESESLKSILTGAPQSKLGRIALVDTLASQIRSRMKLRLPSVLSGLQGKSQIVQDELARLGEQLVNSAEGTRAIALELCREFEDKFLLHLAGGEGSGWKVVASFEGNFPNRIKQLPLDRHFDLNNVKRVVLEADGYQPYLISPEKGLRSLIKIVLELAKDPARLCVDEVHRVLVDIVSASANATPGLGRYPPFKREVVAIASAALDGFKNEAKKMVVALVDMERAFVPPQHFIRLVQRRMERQRREEELKGRSSKKGQDAEQSLLSRATSPQPDGPTAGGSLKSMKDKPSPQDKETPEVSGLKTAGPEGEITAGYLMKKSAKTNGWSRRWFVLNEKTGKLGYTKKQEERNFRGTITLEECTIEEIPEDEVEKSKSSKDKKANGPDSKGPGLVFKITCKVPYKTVLKAHNALVLKAESVVDKNEWINKLQKVIQARGGQVGSVSMRQSLSEGSLDKMVRKPIDPEEELRWMSQEVRGYVEAVLNSLAANVPKAVVLCQVEKAKEDMLNQLYSSISAIGNERIESLIQEDQNVKRRRERYQKQSSLLSKLTRQLSIHDNRAAAASSYSDNSGTESSPRASGGSSGDDWMNAFNSAANGPSDSLSKYGSGGHSRRYSDPAQNGDAASPGSGSNRRTTPNRLPPAPPPTGSAYRY
ncbi:putative dynamin GTPase [Arabidopsis thaliana]|jgi:dynamin GTPase|uniref:Dynamin-2A n=3 Tax=Arabidopsis TaxID=3701 RepID=DRP2A_ARATH|nr:dynamin-like protein 6 [Arabidopsis thaliana]Q9SE83.2 RecName: Full=Dynamin-2A; AltName: Full=Dynamin-like protein 6; AltName: Full=Dynamin-related protein 2A [Arabidopsis thaliana]AEE28562.1 dynamin-like protein 6 [Arabidopsis thaliana]KAG7645794.1 Dynamin-type guanine nucleotide-binding (G) domain [Arabidopsis thaliana x Arabidopsis arenosa]OAP14785.1 DRP2A [Arabidopsis thaliana]|eukprot:NP_172500.1 dynamin-like protein 6 [Arabidopsis thaliana]